MKWKTEQAFRVESKCPFEGIGQTDTVYATTAQEALQTWKVEWGHGVDPVAKPTPVYEWEGAENPDLSDYQEGYRLAAVERERWNFDLNGRKDNLTTWVRHCVKRVWHPSRDISMHETRVIVPKRIYEDHGCADIVRLLIGGMKEWERPAALRGQVYSCDINPETVRVTIVWELDLS